MMIKIQCSGGCRWCYQGYVCRGVSGDDVIVVKIVVVFLVVVMVVFVGVVMRK